jgi:internalin A
MLRRRLNKFLAKNLCKLASIGVITLILAVSHLRNFVAQPQRTTNFSTFAEWCVNKNSLPESTRRTIDAMLSYARTSQCDRASQTLKFTTYGTPGIELSELSLTDIRPLSSLTNLKGINLSSNRITDIRPLSSLPHVEAINLSTN